MKDENSKKVVLIIVALVIIALLAFFAIKLLGNKSGKEVTGEKKEKAEAIFTDYLASMTSGTGSLFNGADVLFSKDEKQTYDDFEKVYIYNAAFSYIIKTKGASLQPEQETYIKMMYKLDNFVAVNGKDVKDAVKAVFGKDFELKSAELFGCTFKYVYDETNDLVIKVPLDTVPTTNNYYVLVKPIKTVEKDKNLEVEVVVAYAYEHSGKYSFTKDSSLKELVYESDKYELDESKSDSFTHFTLTLKPDGDNYVFESIQKK